MKAAARRRCAALMLFLIAAGAWPAAHAQPPPPEAIPSPIPGGTLDPRAPVKPFDDALREIDRDRLTAPALERYEAGDYDAAAKLGTEALQSVPGQHGLRFAVANSLAWTGRYEPALEVWLRQRSKALYTDDGKLGFDVTDIGEWLAFWHDLRKRGAIASAEVAALDMGELDTSLLTVGKTAMVFAHSNQLVGFQALVKSKLGMTMYPSGGAGAKYGQYLKPSMLLSIYARTRHPEAAVKLVDFFVSNKEAGLILGVERGVPASTVVRKAVEPTLDELGQAMASYVAFVSDKVSPLPAPPPQGAGEIQTLLRRANEQIGFGRVSVDAGAKQFMAEANAVLARG